MSEAQYPTADQLLDNSRILKEPTVVRSPIECHLLDISHDRRNPDYPFSLHYTLNSEPSARELDLPVSNPISCM